MAVKFPEIDRNRNASGGRDLLDTEAGVVLFDDYFEAAATSGRIKIWDGASWVLKPLKRWDGAAWNEKPLKRWDGASWV